MKFFSELGACWGGATVTPPSETAGSRNRVDANRNELRSHIRSINEAANWKPKLHSISEEGLLSDSNLDEGNNYGADPTVKFSDKNTSSKIKPNSTTKVSTSSGRAQGFRRSYQIAVNAFAPAPFM